MAGVLPLLLSRESRSMLFVGAMRMIPSIMLVCVFVGGSLALRAQEQPTNSQPREIQMGGMQMPQSQNQMAGGMQAGEMNKMEQSVTAMSQMCQMMMQKEMHAAPLKYGAIIGLGALLGIALILLIVLEVEWVRVWALRLKSEKRKLAQAPA